MRLIGILGGTFNPIHFGHLRMAQEIADTLQLKQVLFVPAANPPHKESPNVSSAKRAEMVELAIEGNTLFKLDIRELGREGASYTIDTLISLRSEMDAEQNSHTAFCLMMGSDAFVKFNTWHRWKEILDYCHIILVQRPIDSKDKSALASDLANLLQDHYTENIDDLSSRPAGFILMQHITALSISSTAIRNAFKHRQVPHYLMPETVIHYIKANALYN